MSQQPQIKQPSLLPTSKTPPKKDFRDLIILVYGKSKIGKSTFCSNFDNAIFLATEAGLNHLEVFETTIPNWQHLLKVLQDLAAGQHSFKTVIIDTVDNMFQMCREYVLAKLKVEHETDLGYGKGFAMVLSEFKRVLIKLSLLPYGLVLISHSKIEEIDTRIGKLKKTVPSIQGQGKEIVLAMADMILYFDTEINEKKEEKRVIRTKPTQTYDAGDRTGKLAETLPLEYKAFFDAYYATSQIKEVKK